DLDWLQFPTLLPFNKTSLLLNYFPISNAFKSMSFVVLSEVILASYDLLAPIISVISLSGSTLGQPTKPSPSASGRSGSYTDRNRSVSSTISDALTPVAEEDSPYLALCI